jgi:hypothetical protein
VGARLFGDGVGDLFAAMAGIGDQYAARPIDPLIAPGVGDLVALRAVPDYRRLPAHGARLVLVKLLQDGERFGSGKRCNNFAVTRIDPLHGLWN